MGVSPSQQDLVSPLPNGFLNSSTVEFIDSKHFTVKLVQNVLLGGKESLSQEQKLIIISLG